MFLSSRRILIAMMVAFGVLFLSSCSDKDYYDPSKELPNPMEELPVPDDFDWKTMNSVNLKVVVDDLFNGQYAYQVDVYDGNPILESGAQKITTGYAKKNSPFATTVTVPVHIESLWVKQTTPTGLSSVMYVSTEKKDITCNFDGSNSTRSASSAMTRSDAFTEMAPPEVDANDRDLFPISAPSDATVIVGSTNTSASKNYIVNGETTDIGDGQNISLYVTEDATLNSMKNIAGRKIYILPGKQLTLGFALNFSTANCQISIGEGARLVTNHNMELAQNSAIYNLGTIDCAGQIYNKGTSIIYNAGTVLANSVKIDTNSKFYNMSKVEVAIDWNAVGGSSGFYNSGMAEITVGGAFDLSTNNIFVNDGTANFNSYSSIGSSKAQNNGEITVKGLTNVDAGSSVWYNNGTWITETMTTKGVGNNFFNACKLIINDKLEMISTVFTNLEGGYVKTTDFHMENTHISMGSGAFIDVTGIAKLVGNRSIDPRGDKYEGMYGIGTGRMALFRMNEAITIDANTTQAMHYSGNLQVACDNHFPYENPINPYNPKQWIMEDGAQWASSNNHTVEIPATECNAGAGGGTNPPTDPDIDPVVDPFTYTYVFEDMWPWYGDYDMNDVVLTVNKITSYVNESNKAEKMSFEFSVRAVGAEKRIAGGLMLDNVQASTIKSVSYSLKQPQTFNVSSSGAENNQSKAVIPLFDEGHDFLGKPSAWYINTTPESPDNVPNPPVSTITIEFTTPIDAGDLNVTYLNMFIMTDINKGYPVNSNSRKEIHLVDYRPTDMANTSLFGANNDDSSLSANRFYRSKDNLPWGIVIPDAFKWPREYTPIQTAYTQFEGWVMSGGLTNKEWWKNPSSPSLIYSE